MKATYTVPEVALEPLRQKLERLQRRALKLGVEPIAVTYGKPVLYFLCRHNADRQQSWLSELEAEKLVDWRRMGPVRHYREVTIEGVTPCLDGFSLVAVLEPVEIDGQRENILQTVPGESCPLEFRTKVGECDHCLLLRKRRQTFVVRDKHGNHASIGRDCLSDFLGGVDPHAAASLAEIMATAGRLCGDAESDGFTHSARPEDNWDLERFVAQAAACVRLDGWVSRKAARERGSERCTCTDTLYCLRPPLTIPRDGRVFIEDREPTEDDAALAVECIEWAATLSDADRMRNEYLCNLNTVCRAGYVTPKTAGLAASILAAAGHAKTKAAEQAARRPSVHVGVVGKRQEFTVTCERLQHLESEEYGVSHLHKLVDIDGNDLTWFASAAAPCLVEGRSYVVKATVKRHDEYKGRRQTLLTRVSVVREVK